MTSKGNTFFKDGELEALFKDMAQKANNIGSNTNAYDAFIQERKNANYPAGTILERHHIVPKHAGGNNSESNLVSLSVKDHIIAHWLRWKVLNSESDKRAYLFRVATSEERMALHREMIAANVDRYRINGLYRHNSEYQKQQGLKGGRKGGLAGTKAQFEARSNVGKQYGPITGKANQSTSMVDFLQKYALWEFDGCHNQESMYSSRGKPKNCPNGTLKANFYVITSPKELFKHIAETLSLFAPGSVNLDNIPTMHKLINGQKRIYGWKLIKTLTRSEVEAGELDKLSVSFFTEETIPE